MIGTPHTTRCGGPPSVWVACMFYIFVGVEHWSYGFILVLALHVFGCNQ